MRKLGLDLCRVVACMMVIFSHTGMLFWDCEPTSLAWAVYNVFYVIIRSSVLIFLMVSGALFLDRDRLDFQKQMRRAGHMLFLFYAWSLICNGFDALFFHLWTPREGFLVCFLSGYFHLWYLPVLVLCYCSLPLLHGLAHGDRDNVLRGTLLMSAIVAVVCTLNAVPEKPAWFEALIAPYAFYSFRYLIMIPLGWVLYRQNLTNRQLALLGVAAAAAVLLISWLNRSYAIRIGAVTDVYYENVSISSVLTGAFIFCACKRVETLPPRLTRLLKILSPCSFGVYLIHPILIDAVRSRHWDLTRYSAFVLYPLFYVFFLVVPFALSWLMLKIPGVRKLVS